MTALIVGAHPDDIELNCCAYALNLMEEGWNIIPVIVASGQITGVLDGKTEIEVRQQEAINASEILGIPKPIFLDNFIGQLSYTTVKKQILDILTKNGECIADLMLTHFPIDAHFDHCIIGTILYDILQNEDFKISLMFFKSTSSYSFIPEMIFQIGKYLDKKFEALCAHRSQGFHKLTKDCVKPTEEFIHAVKRE